VNEYTEEFYQLNIRVGHRENEEEKFARYINGLRYEIQNEISLVMMKTVEDSDQVTLKVEEKLERKKRQKNMGKSPNRGKGTTR